MNCEQFIKPAQGTWLFGGKSGGDLRRGRGREPGQKPNFVHHLTGRPPNWWTGKS
jgi:hypothetical protein